MSQDNTIEGQALPAPAGRDLLAGAEPAAFATFITTDGRRVCLDLAPGGGVTLTVGRGEPAILDRFQAGAVRAAFRSLPEE